MISGDQATTKEHPFGEKLTVAGAPVFLARPDPFKKPSGLTILLTAANLQLAKYLAIRDALLSSDHAVCGYMINVLNPPRNNHRVKAETVRAIFEELKSELRVSQYDIVGHSVGGKIALLVAALHDDDHSINRILALDPVDQSPVEFTNSGVGCAPNLSLKDSKATITMSYTDCSYLVKKEHNAYSINRHNRNTKLLNHRNAGHMCYCDDGGPKLSWKAVMGAVDGGNPERNRICKEEIVAILREKNTSKVSKVGKGIKKDFVESMKDIQKDAENTIKGGAAKSAMKGMFKGVF